MKTWKDPSSAKAMDDAPPAPKKDGTAPRPSSEQLADLHVYLVPEQRWLKKRKLAKNHVTEYAVSAGFIRIVPQYRLVAVRREIERQLGHDVLPQSYVFLRSVGRNFTQVKASQEMDLKAKNFMPPHANEPEIYLKAGSYTDQYWSQGDESSLDDTRDTRRTQDIVDNRVRALSPVSSPDSFLPEVESTKFVLSRPSKVRRSSLSSAERSQPKPSGSFHHVTTTTTTHKSTTTIEERSSTKLVQLVRRSGRTSASLREGTLVKATPIQRTASEKDIEEVDAAPRLAQDRPEDILGTLQRSKDPEDHAAGSDGGTRRGSLLGVGSTGPGYIIVPDGRRRSPSPGPSRRTIADAGVAPSEHRERRSLQEESSGVCEPLASPSSQRRSSYVPDTSGFKSRREETGRDSQITASTTTRRGSRVSEAPSHLKAAERDADIVEEGQRSPSMAGDKSRHDIGASEASRELKAREDQLDEKTGPRRSSCVEETATPTRLTLSDDKGRSGYRRGSIAATSPTRPAQSQGLQEHPHSARSRRERVAPVALPRENIASEEAVGEDSIGRRKPDAKGIVQDSEGRSSRVSQRRDNSEDAGHRAAERSGSGKSFDETSPLGRQPIGRESESKTMEVDSQQREMGSEVEERRDARGDPSVQREGVESRWPGPAVAVGREGVRKHRSKGEKATRRSKYTAQTGLEEGKMSTKSSKQARVVIAKAKVRLVPGRPPGREDEAKKEVEEIDKYIKGGKAAKVVEGKSVAKAAKEEARDDPNEVAKEVQPGLNVGKSVEGRKSGKTKATCAKFAVEVSVVELGQSATQTENGVQSGSASRDRPSRGDGDDEGDGEEDEDEGVGGEECVEKSLHVSDGDESGKGRRLKDSAGASGRCLRGGGVGGVERSVLVAFVGSSLIDVKRASNDEVHGEEENVLDAEPGGTAEDTCNNVFTAGTVESNHSLDNGAGTPTEETELTPRIDVTMEPTEHSPLGSRETEEVAERREEDKEDSHVFNGTLKTKADGDGREDRAQPGDDGDADENQTRTADLQAAEDVVISQKRPETKREEDGKVDQHTNQSEESDSACPSVGPGHKVKENDTGIANNESVDERRKPLRRSSASRCDGDIHATVAKPVTQTDECTSPLQRKFDTVKELEISEASGSEVKEETQTVSRSELLCAEVTASSQETSVEHEEVGSSGGGLDGRRPGDDLANSEINESVKEDGHVEGDGPEARASEGSDSETGIDGSEDAVLAKDKPVDGQENERQEDGFQASNFGPSKEVHDPRQKVTSAELSSLTDAANAMPTTEGTAVVPSDHLRKQEDSGKSDESPKSPMEVAEVGRVDNTSNEPSVITSDATSAEERHNSHTLEWSEQEDSAVGHRGPREEDGVNREDRQTEDDEQCEANNVESTVQESRKGTPEEADAVTQGSGLATTEGDSDSSKVSADSSNVRGGTGPSSSVSMGTNDADVCNEERAADENETASRSSAHSEDDEPHLKRETLTDPQSSNSESKTLDEEIPQPKASTDVRVSAPETAAQRTYANYTEADSTAVVPSGHYGRSLRESPSLLDKLDDATRSTDPDRSREPKKLAGTEEHDNERCQEGTELHAQSPQGSDVLDELHEHVDGGHVDASLKDDVVTEKKERTVRKNIIETVVSIDEECSKESSCHTASSVDSRGKEENSAKEAERRVTSELIHGDEYKENKCVKERRLSVTEHVFTGGSPDAPSAAEDPVATQDPIDTYQDCSTDANHAKVESSGISARGLSAKTAVAGSKDEGVEVESSQGDSDEGHGTLLESEGVLLAQQPAGITSEHITAEKREETGSVPVTVLNDTERGSWGESSDSAPCATDIATTHKDIEVHRDERSANSADCYTEASQHVHAQQENVESANVTGLSDAEQSSPAKPPDTTLATRSLESIQDLVDASNDDSVALDVTPSISQASDRAGEQDDTPLVRRTQQDSPSEPPETTSATLGLASTQEHTGASKGEDDSTYVEPPHSVSQASDHSLDASQSTQGCSSPLDAKGHRDDVELPDEGISVDGSATREFSEYDDDDLTHMSMDVDTAPSSSGRGSESSGTPLLPPVHQPTIKTPAIPRTSRLKGPSGMVSLPSRFHKETRLYESVHRKRVTKETLSQSSSIRRVRSDEGNLDRSRKSGSNGTASKFPGTGGTERRHRLGRNSRSVNLEEHGLLEFERLTRNLEALRSERQVCEAKREDLLRRARFLQHKTTSTRDQARDMWRRRYLDEKKASPRLEEECGRWRLELEKLHRELLAKVDGELRFSGHRVEQPSDRLSYKIMIAKILQEIEDLKRRLEYTRIALGAEVRLRSHAERQVRTLREDLVKKKIQVTLTRKETQTVMAPFLRDSFYFVGAG